MTCMNKIKSIKLGTLAVLFFVLSACATNTNKEDPLKYSKKLITQGHSSLYHNGAFAVPNTEIKLIPAGPRPLELAKEMMGLRARQAFLTSLKNAADSIYIVPEGTKLSIDLAKKIKYSTDTTADAITETSRPTSRFLIDRSLALAENMLLDAWQFGESTASAMNQYGISLEQETATAGNFIANNLTNTGKHTASRGWQGARYISHKSNKAASRNLLFAGDQFVKGYAAVPEKLSKRGKNISRAADIRHFAKGIKRSNHMREQLNENFTELVSDTLNNYGNNVNESLRNAKDSFRESVGATGFGLAFLQSARWVLQAVLWDGLVEPAAKLGTASIGYVTVNLLIFPAMLVVNEGIPAANLAIEVVWNTAGGTYDLLAPTGTAAVASVYSLFQFTGGNLLAGTTGVAGTTIGATEVFAGQVLGNTVKGVGYVAGKGVQYIAVPVAAAGITVGSGTVGLVAGGAGSIAGTTVAIGGETASLGTKAFGNVIAGSTVAVGATASVAASTTVGVYELSKAVVVPTGYELGGGIVLGYGTMTHLAAHSILAVSDASYLVLSLEGPRWVIYAVKGELGDGNQLPPGTLLDLKEMQSAGEEFYYLPLSDDEMTGVVNSVYGELPEKSDVPEILYDEF